VTPEEFIDRWKASAGSERANYQGFLAELAELVDAPRPDPAKGEPTIDAYVFERPVKIDKPDGTSTTNFIDLYKRGCFVIEAKQGSERKPKPDRERPPGLFSEEQAPATKRRGVAVRGTRAWDDAMLKANVQADRYCRALANEDLEGWPPFKIVVDVGHVIELYADFSRSGKTYKQFPNRDRFRISLAQLSNEKTRETLRLIWTDPLSLDPSQRQAKATKQIADRLAALARVLEAPKKDGGGGYAPQTVAAFLMRCLFTMFAEDVGLLPKDCFKDLLKRCQDDPKSFKPMAEDLWKKMNRGGFSTAISKDVKKFNGGLFRDVQALDLNKPWLEQLFHAAEADWTDVEPAIFGALLERALDPRERHKLGAHYTPRAYVERLVEPAVMEPLRADWEAARAAAVKLAGDGDIDRAKKAVKEFHRVLCETRVLDPACGTGNFLYVSLELMKQLEGEVLDQLESFGEGESALEMERFTVDPHQFLGLEINERAVAIAELVLWIGFLQWHFRTRGKVAPPEPILRDFKNIRYQDAILVRGKNVLRRDKKGKPVTRWDGTSHKAHPITGEPVPDESARAEIEDYPDAKPASWPDAEFIVGNPPFTGGKDIRQSLGDGLAEAFWRCHPKLPNSIDLVMYWWDHAARLARARKVRRFGFITTNSLPQTFSRRVVEAHLKEKKPLSLLFAISDHPWVKALDRKSVKGAAQVRIAMTVGAAGDRHGHLGRVISEAPGESDSARVELTWARGKIWSNLRIGADLSAAVPLRANTRLCSPGVKLHGAGFKVTPKQAEQLGLGRITGLESHIRPYRNGRDLTARPRGMMVVDLFGVAEEELRDRFPAIYQFLSERVRPQREAQRGNTNDATSYADKWWLHGKPRSELRKALKGLPRYIATPETSKHRFFQFLDISILPDNMLVNIGLPDGEFLAVLSSRIHVAWALNAGGRMGVGNDPRYQKSLCFDKFPFPELSKLFRRRLASSLSDLSELV